MNELITMPAIFFISALVFAAVVGSWVSLILSWWDQK